MKSDDAQDLLAQLPDAQGNDDVELSRRELAGAVADLAGIVSGAQIGDPEDEYTDDLVRKYSREAAQA